MLYFLCINWTGPTPHGELSKPQKNRPIQHELCLTSFQRAASQNIVTKIYRLNMFWSMSLRSFVWVLDACYRCGRPCIMEMSRLLSVTSFCPNGPPFSTVTSLCCLITSSTNAHSSERGAGEGGDMQEQKKLKDKKVESSGRKGTSRTYSVFSNAHLTFTTPMQCTVGKLLWGGGHDGFPLLTENMNI